MGRYIGFPIETDPKVFIRNAFDFLQSLIVGWSPSDGNLEVWMLEAISQMTAEERDVASAIPKAIFRFYGRDLLRLFPINGAAAIAPSTWSMINADGYTIESGTLVGIRASGDSLIPFRVFNTTVVAPGATVTATGEVLLQALDIGAASNELGAVSGPVELIDTKAFIDEIVLEAITTGGADAETDDDYLDRLSSELQLMTPRPILPADFAQLARRVPGVARALAIDLYDPITDTFDNERMVAIAAIDTEGNAVSNPTKTAIAAYLELLREQNFVVNTFDPTYTEIDVDFTATARPGVNPVTAQAAAVAAVAAYLDPAAWGLPEHVDLGDLQPGEWVSDPTVRYLEVASVIDATIGILHVDTLEINESGGSPGTANVTLDGEAPLPRAGDITGAVS